jgi:Protein of unknown function (DUF3592)
MATTCCCGCGRPIDGIRERANNEAAQQMSQHLAVMRGALDRGEAGDRTAETQAMVDEGAALVAGITRYLHGEMARDDLDKKANKEWLRTGAKLADALVSSASGPAWMPDDRSTTHLAHAGQRANGVVVDVKRAGMGNERVADLAIRVKVRSVDGGEMEITRSLSIAVVQAPRVGDRVEVAYDDADPNRFVYRPRVDLD